jgi:hypothetical protein
MRIQIRADLIEEDLNIPDVLEDRYYSPEEIAAATVVSQCDTTGDVTARLADGKIAVLYSIDLDYFDCEE